MSTSNRVEITYDSYANVLSFRRFDFGNTTPTSTDTMAYGSWNGSACVAVGSSVNDHPCSNIVTDSSGTVAATYNNYDSQGNLLSSKSLVGGSTYLTKNFTYNTHGTVNVATDVNNATSTYSYNGVCNGLFPTGVTISGMGVSLSRGMSWDCNVGAQISATDENGQVTTTNFTNGSVADPFYRPLSVVDPLSNSTRFGYSPTTSESVMNFNGAVSTTDALSTRDGLGRPVFVQKRQGPAASTTTFDSTQTSYGWTTTTTTVAGGRFVKQSMPYSGAAGQPAPAGTKVTTTQYDALGRPITVTDGGGGTISYSYTKNDVLQTIGPAQNFQKQLEYDGLGRLTSVCEVTSASGSGSCGQSNPATGLLTKYTYNSLGGLISVTQNAQPGAVGGQQTRSYAHDGLGRLTRETNPESGTKGYTYDTDSTCGTSNGDLVKKVDAANNVTCYAYDGLHRTTGVTYPSGPNSSNTPAKTFVYDTTTFSCTNGAFVKGRLAEAFTGPSNPKITDIAYCYSPRGEITNAFESTLHSNGTYHTTASYWENGALKVLSGVPAHNAWTFGVDGEGRIYSAVDGTTTNLVTSTMYYPTYASTTVMLGSGDSDTYTYDPNTGRMKTYQYKVGSTPKYVTGTLGWNQNGSLGSLVIADAFDPTNAQNCAYSYDDLVRLHSVNCGPISPDGTTWGQTFSYDAFGNISKSGSITFAASYLLTNGTTNNREQSVSTCIPTYDANGNLTTDCTFIPSYTYAWDSDGNNVGINLGGSAPISLTYDALDRVVEKNISGTYKQILYSPIGKLALMVGQNANNVFLALPGGEQATYTNNTIRFRHYDWLGSARFESNMSEQEYGDVAYAPFGETYAIKNTPYISFTGAQQDTVTGLSDFLYREYNPVQGRWISPDPAGMAAVDPNNPQSWNRYAYVLNSPLSNVDPLGLWCVWEDGTHDGDPNTGGFDAAGCAAQGGHWDAWDTITGIFQDGNGNVTQINYAYNGTNYTCTDADCGASGTLQQFDQTLQTYWQGPAQGQSLDLYLLSVNLRNTVPGPIPTAFFTRPPGPPGPPSAKMTQTQWDAWCDLKTAQVGGFNSDEPHVPEYGVSVYNAQVVTVTKNQTMNPESTSAGTAAQAGGAGLAIVTARGATSSTCKAAYH